MSNQNYRLYSFANYYLSGLQAGLQTAHVVSEMFDRNIIFGQMTDVAQVYSDWARHDKTIIIVNGGNSLGIKTLADQLSFLGEQLGLPVAHFREDEQSLNNAYTTAGIIVPEKYYNTKYVMGTDIATHHTYENEDGSVGVNFYDGTDEFALISLLRAHRLFSS